jgi:hypothetical protein
MITCSKSTPSKIPVFSKRISTPTRKASFNPPHIVSTGLKPFRST